MKRIHLILSVGALLLGGSATAQQMYKWTGVDGKVNYSDTPPPKSAKQSEVKAVGPSNVATDNLPYEVAQAVRLNPVTFYTTAPCAACDTARSFLNKRGVPFSEKTVTTAEDIQRLKQAGGDGTLPLLTVGRAKQIGFENGAWNTLLTSAGYPQVSKLPQGFSNPQASAAAPVVAKISKGSKGSATDEPAADTATAPPAIQPSSGFRF